MADDGKVEHILRAMDQHGERFVHIRDGKTEYVGIKDGPEWKFGQLGARQTVGYDESGRAKVAGFVRELVDRGATFTARDNYDFGRGRTPPEKL